MKTLIATLVCTLALVGCKHIENFPGVPEIVKPDTPDATPKDEMAFDDLIFQFKRPCKPGLPITATLSGVVATESRLTGEIVGAVEGYYNSAATEPAPMMAGIYWERLGWKGGGFDYVNAGPGAIRPRDWNNVISEMKFTPQKGDKCAFFIYGSKSRSNIVVLTIQ